MKIYVATSNKNKVKQWENHFPKEVSLIQVCTEIPEEKLDTSEIVLLKKLLYCSRKGLKRCLADDRALYIEGMNIPGPYINTFLKEEDSIPKLFGGKKGRLVFSCGYSDEDYIHIYSEYLPVKIAKEGGKGDRWLPLGRYLIPANFQKPYSEFNDENAKTLEKQLNELVFRPFVSAIMEFQKIKGGMVEGNGRLENGHRTVSRPILSVKSNDPHWKMVAGYFREYIRNGLMEELAKKVLEILKERNNLEGLNLMTLKNRVLLSLAYYPVQTFFDVKVIGEYPIFNIRSAPVVRGEEIIHRIVDYHIDSMKKDQRGFRIIQEVEDNEASLPEGRIVVSEGKIYVKRGDKREPLRFGEMDENTVKPIYSKLHYLGSYRENLKSFALFNRDDIPVAFISVGAVERYYKKILLRHDGIDDAVEFTRAYNSLYKVKGVLSLLFKLARESLGKSFYLTAYQPNFSRGINIYGSGFGPYIIKPQQNFYEMINWRGMKVPVFRVRRELKVIGSIEERSNISQGIKGMHGIKAKNDRLGSNIHSQEIGDRRMIEQNWASDSRGTVEGDKYGRMGIPVKAYESKVEENKYMKDGSSKLSQHDVMKFIGENRYERGSFPLVPSMEMIYPQVPWIHFMEKLLP